MACRHKVCADGALLEDHETKAHVLKQVYAAIAPDGSELRIRSIDNNTFEQTAKSKGGLVRGEETIPVSKTPFDIAWADDHHPRIEKIRYSIPYEGYVIELDFYEGDLEGLITAEVEFSGETEREAVAASEAFLPPAWFGKDVTNNKEFKNQNLARNRTLGAKALVNVALSPEQTA